MAVKSVGYAANTVASTQRGPSESIWIAAGSPNAWIEDFLQDPSLGVYFWDDFESFPLLASGSLGPVSAGKWGYFGTADATVADGAVIGGVLTMGASTTAGRGNNISSLTGAFKIVDGSGNLQGRLAFETRVSMSTAAMAVSTADQFVGLMDHGGGTTLIPITATPGLLATTPNLIGFHKRGGATNGTDWNFVFQLAGGSAVYPTNLQNLVTTVLGAAPVGGTFYKLGFVFNPAPTQPIPIVSASTGQTVGVIAKPLIQVFVNGLPAAAFLTSTNVTGAAFPTGNMGPVVAFYQQSTTATVTGSCDWVRAAQNAIA